jgi:uncharacterized cofD-like protein
MIRLPRVLYPGLKIKRWIFLLIFSCLIAGVGLARFLSDIFGGIRIDIFPPEKVEAVTDYVKGLKFIDLVALIGGGIAIVFVFKRIIKSIGTVFAPEKTDEFVNLAYKRMQLRKGPRIVAIGGGTGLPAVLSGIKEYTSNITAIVTVADDGGSSGKLIKDFRTLPPGDIRNCLVALADEEMLISKLFQYRFDKSVGLEGHSFGNLFITAMSEVTGDFARAVKESSRTLAVRGEVVPVTLDRVMLVAKLNNGAIVEGESKLGESRVPIENVFLKPDDAKPTEDALFAIKNAHAIVFGPGSLYTSVLPNLLVNGITDAIMKSKAVKIYVCNIMTEPGETDGYSATDHVNAIFKHTKAGLFYYVIVNTEEIPSPLIVKYKQEYSDPVAFDYYDLKKHGVSVIRSKVINTTDDYVRHDPTKLAKTIIRIISI